MTKRITANLLRSNGACPSQVKIFAKQWPKGIVPTKRQIPVIVRLRLDANWAARNLLSNEGWKVYEEAMVLVFRAYKKACENARELLEKEFGRHRMVYEYEKAEAAALRVYEEAEAAAFIKAWRETRS